MSHPVIVNMILFINISFSKNENIHIMTLSAGIGTTEMIVLRFCMQGKDIIERTNGKCHMSTL